MNKVPARPTVADVARVAGVSRTTVSHALSGKGRVDARTRSHVQQVAAELGYVPSRTARNLALGRSDTVGLLLPQVAHLPLDELLRSDWYGRVAVIASQEALRHQRALTILPAVHDPGELASFGLDALVVLDPMAHDPRWPVLRASSARMVLLGRDPAGILGPSVIPDLDQGITILMDHLAACGARTYGVIAPDIPWASTPASIESTEQWCAQRGAELRIGHVRLADCRTREEAAAAAQDVAMTMLRAPDRPDALIGLLEDFGRGVIAAARSLGLSVPGDVLVAQDVDGIHAQLSDPPITAIELNLPAQLAAAMDLLFAQERTVQATSGGRELVADEVITVPVSLAVRASTVGKA
ncbi:MAG: LacI family transcriptional regulator [Actinomycetales bacterium]|nr:LacI family transcriptional regulator [Actinomycetales bacterium]